VFESKIAGYMFLKGDINVTAQISEGNGNLLTIDSHLTIYGSDEHLRKIADTIQNHLERKSDTNECTTYRKQAG